MALFLLVKVAPLSSDMLRPPAVAAYILLAVTKIPLTRSLPKLLALLVLLLKVLPELVEIFKPNEVAT